MKIEKEIEKYGPDGKRHECLFFTKSIQAES